MPQTRPWLTGLLWTVCVAGAAAGAEPWHLDGHGARAVVEIAHAQTDPNVDTAAVRIFCHGRAKADGADYRVLDANGQPVPFAIVFHDAERYGLIAFRGAGAGSKFFVYFDNPSAGRAAEQVDIDHPPGAGPPTGAWIPRHGFVLRTIQRPEGRNPKTVDELKKLVAGSERGYGARMQQRVSEGLNVFGPSDYYISIYRGWINIPKPGTYHFCTASNEASFSFIDGKELIHWPGRHTTKKGETGEKYAAVELTAGLHYLEYYHEEVMLGQTSFLGWAPPGARQLEGRYVFDAIPESIYTAPHEATVRRYESKSAPLVSFEPTIVDSAWPDPSVQAQGQYTRVRFAVTHGDTLPAGATFNWDFGDGLSAQGSQVEHVYLGLDARGKGRLAERTHRVTLTAQWNGQSDSATWPLLIYETQERDGPIGFAKVADYVKHVSGYDASGLNDEGIVQMMHLLYEGNNPRSVLDAGKILVQRPNADPAMAAHARRLMGQCALKLGEAHLDEAIEHFRQAAAGPLIASEKLEALAQLIRLLGVERGRPDDTKPFVEQVEKVMTGDVLDKGAVVAYRHALDAAGDVLLWHAKPEEARPFYQRVELLRANPLPPQVKAARIGSFPHTIRSHLNDKKYGEAESAIDRWERMFPTEKLNGQTFFWRGKLLHLRSEHERAARYLARAVGLGVGAPFEAEARWLLAVSLEQIGRTDDANRELAKLIASGLVDPFAEQAKEKLAKIASKEKP